jgi:hypothetical protein
MKNQQNISEQTLETRLENLDLQQINALPHQQQLRLTILNAKKSGRVSLWLLFIPFIFLFGGLAQSVFHILIPPWSWLVVYSPLIPAWLKILIFAVVLIIIPAIAIFLNILSILWIHYDKAEHVLHISLRMRRTNVIIISVAGILALLFIGHSITEWITNG